MTNKIIGGLFCLFIIITLLSCSKNDNNSQWITMTQEDVYKFLVITNKVHMKNGPSISSDKYCIPTVKWINSVYAPYLNNFYIRNEIGNYTDVDNNCVKFSLYGQTAGYLIHYKGEGPKGTTLAIGVVDYVIDLDNAHSINFFIAIDDNNKLIIYYYDPQSFSEVPSKDIETDWLYMRL